MSILESATQIWPPLLICLICTERVQEVALPRLACYTMLVRVQRPILAYLYSRFLEICPAREEAELVAAGEVEDLPF